MLHDTLDAFHDIIDVGEIALTVAVVEDLDGLSLPEFVGESEISHIRATGRAIDGEETESRGRDIIEFGVSMRQQFVALLRGGIEADGVVHFVVGRVGHLLVGTIDAGRGGIDEVFYSNVNVNLNLNLRPTPALP